MDRDTGRKNAKGGTIWESADFNGTNDEINAAWGNPRDPDDGRSFKRLIEERTSFGHEPPSADFADEPRKENADRLQGQRASTCRGRRRCRLRFGIPRPGRGAAVVRTSGPV